MHVEQAGVLRLAGQREARAARGTPGRSRRRRCAPLSPASSSAAASSSPGRSATSSRPPRHVDHGHERGDERHQHLAAVGRAQRQQVLAGAVDHVGDLTDRRAVGGDTGQADELVVVELLGVLGRLGGVDVGDQDQPAQRLGRGAVGELGEGDEQPGLVPAGALHGQRRRPAGTVRRAAARGAGDQHGAVGEPAVRLVGARLDGHLAPDAVRPADPADDDLVAAGLLIVCSCGETTRRGPSATRLVVLLVLGLSAAGRRRRSRPGRRPCRRAHR